MSQGSTILVLRLQWVWGLHTHGHLMLSSSIWWVLASVMEKVMAPHSSPLAWKIPWTEEPGGLQPMGSLRVGHD